MKNEVLLFSGTTGDCGCGLGGKKTMARRGFYDGYTKTRIPTRKRTRRSFRGLSTFGVSKAGVKETLKDVKGIVYTGAIAGAGALATNYVWARIKKSIDPKGEIFVDTITGKIKTELIALGKIATGIALGLIVSKLLKKPALGATLAMGPVVVGIVELIKPMVPSLAGVPEIYPANRWNRAMTRAPFSTIKGIPSIGPGMIPDFLPEVQKGVPSWDMSGGF